MVLYDKEKVGKPKKYYQIKYKDPENVKPIDNGEYEIVLLHLGMENPPWENSPSERLIKWLANLYNPTIFDVAFNYSDFQSGKVWQ